MKFCVIGVGRFGHYVAVTLADHGMEVLAVDSNATIIESIKDRVTQAVCMSVDDEEALRSIGVEEMDTVIVAMGENFAQSILVTAILKQRLNIKTVITRSISSIHKDILELIGADMVVLPEREMGIKLADQLSLSFRTLLRITPKFSISQIAAPYKFVGKSLGELNLSENYHVTCVGRKDDDEIMHLDHDYIITQEDVLFLAGNNKDLDKIAKLS